MDSSTETVVDSSKQTDLYEVLSKILKRDSTKKKSRAAQRLNFSVVPSFGYSLSTGFAVDVVANVAFYTSKDHKENLSFINGEGVIDTRSQRIFINRSEIWGANNQYKFITDIRFEQYPTDDYGLGTLSGPAQDRTLDYTYTRVYGTFFKKVAENFYAGLGYNYDHHYNIKDSASAINQDFEKYGRSAQSTSSGGVANLLFDNRANSINPLQGAYASVIFRQNATFLGSDAGWRSVLVDVRKYFRPVSGSNNVLAFWGMAWLSSAQTPYLDLPATGQDTYNNAGRGYIQGRFRGRTMVYLESEYRFGLSQNGLFGGVLFANGQSFSSLGDNKLSGFAPAGGAGLRVKVNKHSNTNICIDYGVGIRGSRGLFVNLGEVF